jgi:hypothetical protein
MIIAYVNIRAAATRHQLTLARIILLVGASVACLVAVATNNALTRV